MANNKHIAKLIEIVEIMIMTSKKLQQFITILIYIVALQKSLLVWLKPLQKCDVSICLVRKLIMICPSSLASNRNHPITQVVESINRMKNSFIVNKIIIVR